MVTELVAKIHPVLHVLKSANILSMEDYTADGYNRVY